MRDVPLLDADIAQFIQRGVSINVASCSADNEPSVCRALGCRVSADLRKVVLFFSAGSAASLLADLRNEAAIAAVFSRPTTHQAIQIKGRDVRFVPLAEEDYTLMRAYRNAYIAEIVAMGHRELIAGSIVPEHHTDTVAISFTPTAAYVQTPGPSAGQSLQDVAWRQL